MPVSVVPPGRPHMRFREQKSNRYRLPKMAQQKLRDLMRAVQAMADDYCTTLSGPGTCSMMSELWAILDELERRYAAAIRVQESADTVENNPAEVYEDLVHMQSV